jgi:hypothetical protein
MPDSKPGQFTSLFMRDFGSPVSPADKDIAPSQEPAKPSTGEFTKLFGAPLAMEDGKSTAYDGHASESRSGTGEFNQMFGSDAPDTSAEVSSHPGDSDLGVRATGGSSTRLFGGDDLGERRSSEESYTASPATPFGKVDDGGATQVFAGPREQQEHPDRATSREPLSDPGFFSQDRIPDPRLFNAADGGATIVFKSPRDVAVQGDPGLPVGPSPWTVFINREEMSALASESADASPACGTSSRAAAPAVAAAAPFITPPAVPSFQAPPALPAVAPPVIAMPPVSTSAGQPSAGTKSYWPLIIILNVLFILAVLLILYFALKH